MSTTLAISLKESQTAILSENSTKNTAVVEEIKHHLIMYVRKRFLEQIRHQNGMYQPTATFDAEKAGDLLVC